MKAFFNDEKIKEKYVSRVIGHQKADEIVKGKYWENGKGCAVGCSVHSSSHSAYEMEIGIPSEVARLEDVIFEGLPLDYAKKWPVEFMESVPLGADLSMVWPKFMIWIMDDVVKYARPDGKKAIKKVKDLFIRWVNGDKPSVEEFKKARADAAAAAAAAAADAAYAAAYAADAAYAAAAADAAADAAYAAAAAAAAREKFWISASVELIRLIKECK